MDDIRVVMDAVGSGRAALFAVSEGGPISLLFAATYPARVEAIVLSQTFALLRGCAWRARGSPQRGRALGVHRDVDADIRHG